MAEPPDRASFDPDSHDRHLLLEALQNVPPKQRAALVLRFVHGLSVEQVSQALNCSTGTVKSRTARGLQTLRAAYTPERA